MKEIMLLLCFLCSFMMIFGIFYYFMLNDKRVEKRLKYYLDINEKYKKTKKKENKEKVKLLNFKNINLFLSSRLTDKSNNKIELILRSSGLEMDPEEYMVLVIISTVFCGLTAGMLLGHFLFIIPGSIIGYFIPKAWINEKRKKRIKTFNDALPDMIMTIVGSLKAGYSFVQAMKTVAEECESPVKEEVIAFLKETSYGITMEDALNNLKLRMPSNDLDLMIQAILIQRQVGGNLSMILEVIVKTIKERNSIDRHVRSLTAQGKLSGKVVGLLPVFIFIALSLVNPGYMEPFTSSIIGKIALGVGVIMEIIGFIIMNKLAKIEV
ncbi:MAG: type II secretion system F family protein [Bacillota bacterium]|nr:type II secretion system F family protein [Bacillota bacterium]